MSVLVKTIMEGGERGTAIDVECHLSNGLPTILIVGFANKAIEEAKERIRSAFASAKLTLPSKRITVNLAPADIPKDGTSFDLAIATAILLASQQIKPASPEAAFLGELGLDGNVRAVRGIIGKLLQARALGHTTFYIPQDNLAQTLLVPGITVIPVNRLQDLHLDLAGSIRLKRYPTGAGQLQSTEDKMNLHDFSDVVGQHRAKRALEIAVAGMHNAMLNGPPGAGKSMLAKAVPSIIPPMGLEEVLEVTHLHSLASRQYDRIIRERPFRAPHHTASNTSIIGGGTMPRPGEISLSHRGVLFFDEFPEFNRSTIEALRQPLEDRVITVARSRDTISFPANFILIATSNPCPCGYYGTSKACTCQPYEIQRYHKKLSGPIMDRIDLYVDVDEVRHRTLLGKSNAESSESIQARVAGARRRQMDRYQDPLKSNATLSSREIKKFISLSDAATELLNTAAERMGISARGYMRSIKVAQTIADLEAAEIVDVSHITEALQYRRQDVLLTV